MNIVKNSLGSLVNLFGEQEDAEKRLYQHNNPIATKFSSKHLPWQLICYFPVSKNRAGAIRVEKYIKKQKSRKLIERLIHDKEEQYKIAQLVRVPMNRD